MKRMVLISALVLLGSAPAWAQSVEQRLQNALGFEWFMANCEEAANVNAMMAMSAAMMINGHTITDVEAAREALHSGIEEQFPDPEAACADYSTRLKPQ